jgi:hypothetical protein
MYFPFTLVIILSHIHVSSCFADSSVVAVDSRVSYRSEDPTVGGGTLAAFYGMTGANLDVSQYMNETSEVYAEMIEIAAGIRAVLEDPSFTMIGENIDIIRDAFVESTGKGQPWQVRVPSFHE